MLSKVHLGPHLAAQWICWGGFCQSYAFKLVRTALPHHNSCVQYICAFMPPAAVCIFLWSKGNTCILHSLAAVVALNAIEDLSWRWTCRFKSKKKAFSRYVKKYSEDGSKGIAAELEQLKKHCSVIRVLAHTQIRKIDYGQKKAHLAEIQVIIII